MEENRKLNYYEILNELKKYPKFTMAKCYNKDVFIGFVMLDDSEDSLLHTGIKTYDEAIEELKNYYNYCDYVDYLLHYCGAELNISDLEILHLMFEIVKHEEKENWIKCESMIKALCKLEDGYKIKASLGNYNREFENINPISVANFLQNYLNDKIEWYYLEK